MTIAIFPSLQMSLEINKMSSRLPLAFYAGLRIADLPGPWHYEYEFHDKYIILAVIAFKLSTLLKITFQ